MIIKLTKFFLSGLCCVLVGTGACLANGTKLQDTAKEPPLQTAGSKKSPCLDCHDDPKVLSILNRKHAMVADKRTPFAKDACQTCHGESTEHMASGGAESPSVNFGVKSKISVSEQNKVCLRCHESGTRMEWKGSPHQTADLPCANCHAVHADQDKALDKRTQPEVCFGCHKSLRAQIYRFSHHPIKEGKMDCTGCHNPHGSVGPKLLNKPTLNETCYTCHAEKRGPFLWEHQPAREDCSICHTPHGSSHKPLLTARGPWLCQQCHLEQRHPSSVYNSLTTSTGAGVQQVLAKNCLNCHPQVHGTNHPSGARKTR